VRVERFEEAVKVVQGLLRTDGPFTFDGEHYQVHEHTLRPAGAAARTAADHRRRRQAGALLRRPHADIVSINVNLREGTGGAETAPDATPERTREKVAWVKEAAGDRFDDLELNSLIGFVMITDDAPGLAEADGAPLRHQPGRRPARPLALLGTLDEMAEELRVAPGRVRHLLLVDRIGRLGGARPGRGQLAGT
jgi:hypothetical protein